MGTRSWIIGPVSDHQAVRITCHQDSQSWELGRRLQEHYNTPARLRGLLRHGDAVSIQNTTKESVFFHRDRKRPMSKMLYPSVQEAIRDFSHLSYWDIEYVYVMWPGKNGHWSFMNVTPEGLTEPCPINETTIQLDIDYRCNPEEAELIRRAAAEPRISIPFPNHQPAQQITP